MEVYRNYLENHQYRPEHVLPELRGLLSLNPLAVEDLEDLAQRLDCPAWVVEAALEALEIEGVVFS